MIKEFFLNAKKKRDIKMIKKIRETFKDILKLEDGEREELREFYLSKKGEEK